MTEQERAAASAENYRRMRAELDRRLSLDPELRKLSKKIRNGKANFNDTFRYSEIVSKYLGEIMQENIGTITNPLGKEYVCKELLRDHYEAINDVLGEVQVALDEELGIHLNPVKAPRNDERIAQVAHALEDPTVKPETIRRRAKAPVVNTAMSMHDDYIRVNAKLRNDLGLKPILQRFGTGCCAWCAAVAGKWRFGEQPDDVFRRHDNCDCVIIYDTQVLRGVKTQDGGRSKTWTEVDPSDLQTDPPKVFSQAEAEQLQENAVSRLTLAGERDIMKLDSIELFNGSDTLAANTKTDLDKALDPVPEKLLERLSGYVSNVEISNGRGYSSYNRSTHEIILNGDTAAFDIVHELGHAFGDMLGLYDDEEFLGILSDGLNIDDWYDVLRMKHPYTGADVWVLNAEKFVDPYQGRIYADVSDVDWSAPIDKKFFREYISVGFDTFFSNPELLKSKDLKLYEFLRGKVYG